MWRDAGQTLCRDSLGVRHGFLGLVCFAAGTRDDDDLVVVLVDDSTRRRRCFQADPWNVVVGQDGKVPVDSVEQVLRADLEPGRRSRVGGAVVDGAVNCGGVAVGGVVPVVVWSAGNAPVQA